MSIVDNVKEAFRFKETKFYKESNDLKDRYKALKKLNEEYPNNMDLIRELYIVKKGLDGENEIAYQLNKSSIGMLVLRDVNVRYENLTAQIDYIIITPLYTYFVECKNLAGNITVTEKGDFIRELNINGRKIKKSMYSPYRQVEAQREVMRKIWESKASKFDKILASNYYNHYRRLLVVIADKESILNTNKAPKEMKYKIIKADNLIRQIQYDIDHRDKDDYIESKAEMEKRAQSYLAITVMNKEDYYEYYKNKYCNNVSNIKEEELRNRLINFRKKRAKEMNIPAYYVFTNDELDKLLEVKPKNIEELKNAKILPAIKIKTHGEQIISEINK